MSLASSAPMPVGYQAGQGRPAERAIIHLDMDCFFASVAELSDPALKGKPIAVCHSNSGKGTVSCSAAPHSL